MGLPASRHADAHPRQDYDNLNSVLILWGRLPAILEEVQWKEMWGIQLDATNHAHAPTRVVLFKFLTARHDNVEKAAEMLKKSLLWRKETRPRSLLEVPYHPRFEALGCVSKHTLDDGSNKPVVVTWNLWSNMKNNDREILAHVDAWVLVPPPPPKKNTIGQPAGADHVWPLLVAISTGGLP